MSYLILRYKLRDGVSKADFERWVVEVDHPKMRGLSRVESFNTFRVNGLLMGEGAPSADYVELFKISDMGGFTSQDMPGEVVQSVMGEFMGFVDTPEFLIVDSVNPAS